jgi:hypothetical protein
LPLCLVIILSITLAAAGRSPARAKSAAWLWIIEEVDSAPGRFGASVGLALGSDGSPHVSYYDDDQNVLMYARRTSGGWQRTVVDDWKYAGGMSDIALDSMEHPHIAYRAAAGNTLKYAYWNGSRWKVHFLGANEYGWDPSLVLDGEDHPHIAYLGYYQPVSGGQTPKYRHWDGSAWQIDVIEPVFVYSNTSIALDSQERPHVTYHHGARLKHAVYDGDRWQVETVDSRAMSGHKMGLDSSLAIDDADNLHISYALYGQEWYSSPWPEGLRYARSQGGTWEYDAPDGPGDLGFYTSLGLDADNRPHISYYDSGSQALKHVYWDGEAWPVSVVDSPVSVGGYTSLDLDQDGQPHIAYSVGGAVRYARRVAVVGRAFLPWAAR